MRANDPRRKSCFVAQQTDTKIILLLKAKAEKILEKICPSVFRRCIYFFRLIGARFISNNKEIGDIEQCDLTIAIFIFHFSLFVYINLPLFISIFS